jgi:hypothetical protein
VNNKDENNSNSIDNDTNRKKGAEQGSTGNCNDGHEEGSGQVVNFRYTIG